MSINLVFMPTITLPDRQQLTFMNCLDDMVAPDHPVRLFDALIDRIIAENPDCYNQHSTDRNDGRPSYPHPVMLKLCIYGYHNRIDSCRRLHVESTRNIELIWLMHGLQPCFKTIANYIRQNRKQIERLDEQVVRFMADQKLISGKRIAMDGTKLKAYTGWEMYDHDSLDASLQKAQRRLEAWVNKLLDNANTDGDADADTDTASTQPDAPGQVLSSDADADAGTDISDDAAAFSDSIQLLEQIEKLQRKIDKLNAIKAELDRQGCDRISPADPEARLMRSRRGKLPAYNLQTVIDEVSKMIVVARISQNENDFEELIPNFEATLTRLGVCPQVVMADTGYADLGDVQQIELNGETTCYIPENNKGAKKKAVTFDYIPEEDHYLCSQGKPLERVGKMRYSGAKQAHYEYFRGTQCHSCDFAKQCTSARDGVRKMRVFHGAKWRDKYARRMKSAAGRKFTSLRKAVAEHPFGTLKNWMGYQPLKHRGIDNCQTLISIYASAYNMKRWLSTGSFEELWAQVMNWTPKMQQTGA